MTLLLARHGIGLGGGGGTDVVIVALPTGELAPWVQ